LKNQKPIDVDAHFKYRCPKTDCGFDHWLSLKESQTKGFKIVCDCGLVFRPKRIQKIEIVFSQPKPLAKVKQEEVATKEKSEMGLDLLADCAKVLIGYGFTDSEAKSLCKKAFEKNPVDNSGSLIRYILQNLEDLNVNN
jgi:hypothetical protein